MKLTGKRHPQRIGAGFAEILVEVPHTGDNPTASIPALVALAIRLSRALSPAASRSLRT